MDVFVLPGKFIERITTNPGICLRDEIPWKNLVSDLSDSANYT